MGKKSAIILFTTLLGLLASLHPILRYYESKKEARIPYAIAQAEEWQKNAKSYFSDGILTNKESEDLYTVCRDIISKHTLRNSMGEISSGGSRINDEFYNLSHKLFGLSFAQKKISVVDNNGKMYETIGYGEDVSNSGLGGRVDEVFNHYLRHLNSKEYKDLVKPKEAKERLALVALGIISD